MHSAGIDAENAPAFPASQLDFDQKIPVLNLIQKKVEAWIAHLIGKDVPPKNVSVVGASKGGNIAARISSALQQPTLDMSFLPDCLPGRNQSGDYIYPGEYCHYTIQMIDFKSLQKITLINLPGYKQKK